MTNTSAIQTDESGRKFIDMTPTWEEILPTWRFMVEQVTTRDKPRNGSDPNKVMMEFWQQMATMAEAADKWNAECKLTTFDRAERLREDGNAVVIFTPEELKGADSGQLEDVLIERGNIFIDCQSEPSA